LERASGELSLSHYRVLSAIASGDERASRVAARLAVGKPTISATVESLYQRGLLVRSTVEGDHRAAALRLTAPGEAMLARVEAEMVARLEDLGSRTPDGGRLIESLVWLGDAIEADAAERQVHRGRDPR
jgi:DNA-binding MarR family transcriptional regulator